ncbi:glycoside hydrolase family 16 protein [Colwellia echini]|uniref:Glycoside hydrolase family 16 protein n=1 Tax=Colwellia echini TaxID=1982103 RepID=A0ABY3MYE6_9GAMM|nr:glycoside hydrolase family 16 protein [Colwellia echini]TYK66258.1 glycoside hydrolase family 16 protein [Colwellia echini]
MTKTSLKPLYLSGALSLASCGLISCSSISNDIDNASDLNVQPFNGTQVSDYKLAWSDEFSGNNVDEDRWHYRLDCKHWSKQQKENTSVGNGVLSIHLKKETVACPDNKWLQPGQNEGDTPAGVVQYTAGGLISNKEMRYGYYEARLKTPSGAGWHSSFWMMRDGIKAGDPAYSQIELDPFENDSIDNQHYQIDAHQWRPKPGTEDPGKTQNKVGTKQVRFTDDTRLDEFHVYGMEFTETTLRYFFDGKLMKETAFSAEQYKHNDVSIWLTGLGTFLGNTKAVDDTQLPEQMQVDYVRFYKKQ